MVKKNNLTAVFPLPGGINNDGTLSKFTKVRVDRALNIYFKGNSRFFLSGGRFSVMLDDKLPYTESDSIIEYVKLKGISDKNILRENVSMDTVMNFFQAYKLFVNNDVKKVIVVTSNIHLKRASYIAEKLLVGISYKCIGVSDGNENMWGKVLKEFIFYTYTKYVFFMIGKIDYNSFMKRYKKYNLYYSNGIFSGFIRKIGRFVLYHTPFEKSK